MTCIPVSISLDTAFSASMRDCIILNFGIAITNIAPAMSNMAMTPVTITKFMCACVWYTLMIDHVHMHGAKSIMRSIIVDVICTCCISLVARVISDDVLNSVISAFEKDMTLVNSRDLRSRPMLAPTLAASRDIKVVNIITDTDMSSMRPPHLNMKEF